jgi:hypothetical protein
MFNVRLKAPRLDDVGWGEPYDTHTASMIWPKVTDCDRFGTLRLKLDVVAAAGAAPTLDVTLEHSPDASSWATLGTFAQKTSVSSESKVFGPCHRYVRSKWTIAGTSPSFQFSILGQGV